MLSYPLTLAGEIPADDLPDFGSGTNDGSWFMVIVVLALIVGLIVLLIRYLAYKNNSWFQGRSLRHLGGVGVGQNKSVQLIKVSDTIYVIGVGNDVELLDKIEDAAEVNKILESLSTPPMVPGSNLLAKLTNWMESRKKLTVSKDESTSPEAESFQELFHSKLQQVGSRRANLKDLLDDDKKTDGKHHE